MITKKLYKECVQAILDFNQKDMEIYKATSGFVDFANFDELNDVIIKFIQLLEYCTKEEPNDVYGTDLQYFIYDLSGGKDYKPGTITDNDGKAIACATIDDLWQNFIIANHPEVEDKEVN